MHLKFSDIFDSTQTLSPIVAKKIRKNQLERKGLVRVLGDITNRYHLSNKKKSLEVNVLQRIKHQNAQMRAKYRKKVFKEDEYVKELPNGDRQTKNYVKFSFSLKINFSRRK